MECQLNKLFNICSSISCFSVGHISVIHAFYDTKGTRSGASGPRIGASYASESPSLRSGPVRSGTPTRHSPDRSGPLETHDIPLLGACAVVGKPLTQATLNECGAHDIPSGASGDIQPLVEVLKSVLNKCASVDMLVNDSYLKLYKGLYFTPSGDDMTLILYCRHDVECSEIVVLDDRECNLQQFDDYDDLKSFILNIQRVSHQHFWDTAKGRERFLAQHSRLNKDTISDKKIIGCLNNEVEKHKDKPKYQNTYVGCKRKYLERLNLDPDKFINNIRLSKKDGITLILHNLTETEFLAVANSVFEKTHSSGADFYYAPGTRVSEKTAFLNKHGFDHNKYGSCVTWNKSTGFNIKLKGLNENELVNLINKYYKYVY